jgi:hypothetical protein
LKNADLHFLPELPGGNVIMAWKTKKATALAGDRLF